MRVLSAMFNFSSSWMLNAAFGKPSVRLIFELSGNSKKRAVLKA